MFVQMCIKGMNGIALDDARAIMNNRGLTCAWWRNTGHISPAEIDQRLTAEELDLHVNWYEEKHPTRSGLVKNESPFISLTAGCVERDEYLAKNEASTAHEIAMYFATKGGSLRGECFLFYCWVFVGMRPNVPVRHLAEEVRELNTYTKFSPYHREGEIAAKIEVPARHIQKYEHYQYREDGRGLLRFDCVGTESNKRYVNPHEVTNYRGMLMPDSPVK